MCSAACCCQEPHAISQFSSVSPLDHPTLPIHSLQQTRVRLQPPRSTCQTWFCTNANSTSGPAGGGGGATVPSRCPFKGRMLSGFNPSLGKFLLFSPTCVHPIHLNCDFSNARSSSRFSCQLSLVAGCENDLYSCLFTLIAFIWRD